MLSTPKMKNARISTIQWVQQWTSKQVQHETVVEDLEQHFDANKSVTNNPNTNDPVNIICFDGGGAKGIAHLAILEELSLKAGQNVLPVFDLAGGSSVGGITSLMCNFCGGEVDEVCRIGYKTSNEVRERTFKKFRMWNLFKRGYLQNKSDNMPQIFHEAVGNAPLYNPTAMKAFALCTVRSHQEANVKAKNKADFEPFVLRTYDMYKEAMGTLGEEESQSLMQMPGTNEVELWEALTATSAAPVLANRVEMTINGQTSRFADGAVISNSPVAIAINEAQSIWPDRPLGVILSISLGGSNEDELIRRSVAAAQKSNPSLHFLRLQPPCLEKYSFTETNEEMLEQLKDDVRSYVRESSEIDQLLASMKKQQNRHSVSRKSRSSVFVNVRKFLPSKRHSIEEVNLKINKIAAKQAL